MDRSEDRKKVLVRLKSIEGHIRGIERMVEEDVYCIDIMKQTLAVQKALDKVNSLIMQNHLNECVTTAIKGNDARRRQQVIGELVDVFEMSHKV
jgi:DNA-binding FrmR family transcriptional regulator